MSAGTLTLNNNSAAVTGSGTAFTTDLASGDFIVVTVGGIPYTLAIKTVNSNTSLTLVSSYTGPTQAGAAWYAVPRVAMNLVTAALVTQSAEALRGLNYDKQNWQSIFSGTGNVTVNLPDGSSYTGPAWNSFTQALNGKADKVSGAVPVNQGGTGATNAADARSNLGLGDSAAFTGNVTTTGSFTGGAGAGVAVAPVVGSTKNKVEMNNRVASSSNGAYMGWSAYYYIDEYVLAGIRRGPATSIYSYAINFNGTSAFEFLATGNATAPGTWTSNSDLRIKENVKRVSEPLEKMKMLSGCTWERKDGMGPGIGFIAQEVQSVFPEAVFDSGSRELEDGTLIDNVLSVDVSGVAAALHHEAILALMDIVEDLTKQIEALHSGS
ncbi:tail fiber domain-containing protein [Enterobacter cancerogenus]|uniref:tail fiber domain-containing protein n=1 Tax=Enterobacter cancerogenus TaxID=69218 RepID=UPI00405924EB